MQSVLPKSDTALTVTWNAPDDVTGIDTLKAVVVGDETKTCEPTVLSTGKVTSGAAYTCDITGLSGFTNYDVVVKACRNTVPPGQTSSQDCSASAKMSARTHPGSKCVFH